MDIINKTLVENRPENFNDCVVWANTIYDQWFNEDILQQLQAHPSDEITPNGTNFWSGTKRCPHPLEFSTDHKVFEL